jgi:hypothetical protein
MQNAKHDIHLVYITRGNNLLDDTCESSISYKPGMRYRDDAAFREIKVMKKVLTNESCHMTRSTRIPY